MEDVEVEFYKAPPNILDYLYRGGAKKDHIKEDKEKKLDDLIRQYAQQFEQEQKIIEEYEKAKQNNTLIVFYQILLEFHVKKELYMRTYGSPYQISAPVLQTNKNNQQMGEIQ